MIESYFEVKVKSERETDTYRCGEKWKPGETKTLSVNKRELVTLRGTLGFIIETEKALDKKPENYRKKGVFPKAAMKAETDPPAVKESAPDTGKNG